MRPKTIRIIDICIGKPICFLLTVIRRGVAAISPQSSHDGPVQKILLLKLIEQGATVLAFSAIRRSIDMVGRQNVYFLVFAENQEIIHLLDIIPAANIFTIRSGNFLSFLFDIGRSLLTIRRLHIDAVVDMEFFSRASAIISFLTGAKRRAGLHRFTSEAPYRGDLMTHRLQYNPYIHTAQAYYLLVEALTMDEKEIPLPKFSLGAVDDAAPRFIPDTREGEAMKTLLRESFGREIRGPVVLLNPNAGDLLPLRKWPVGNFILLGKTLLEAYGDALVVITGAPSEKEAAVEISDRIGSSRAISLAGKTDLRELLVLYTIADILVTNDSGPAHFASMTNIDNIILFGPETPLLFGPTHGRFHTISAKLACSPCVNAFNHRFSPCANNVCMQAISVGEVAEAVRICLAERRTIGRNIPEITD